MSKAFSAVRALAGVSLTVQRGEIVGLIGANGAGKSTLMRVLAGVTGADSGLLLLDGEPAHFGSARAALGAGIALVTQELHLVDALSVAENVMLGQMPRRGGVLNAGRMRDDAAAALARLGGTKAIDVAAEAAQLSPVERRLVTIARALARHPRVLILDEPTAALPTDTAEALLPCVRALADEGVAVLYVSHRLREIKELAHRVVAMRNGSIVADRPVADVTTEQMVAMVGGDEVSVVPAGDAPGATGTPAIAARRLSGRVVEDVDLDVFPGEIVGLSGLQGSGRSELLRLLVGLQTQSAGEVELLGGGPARSLREAAGRGIGYLAEGRSHMALTGMSSMSNLTIAALPALSRARSLIDGGAERDALARMTEQLGIVGRPREPIETLSGGNQQKVFLGRWLLKRPRLMIFDEPTAGMDVHARAEFHGILRALSREGVAVLMASAEPEEIALVCTRALVLVEGRIAHEYHPPFRPEQLVAASYSGR